MLEIIDIDEFWKRKTEVCILDVRTPAEFAKGHIPDALNLPLFSNEERVAVGTTYKQVDPREAFFLGLDFVRPKMRQLVEQAQEMANGKAVAVHCWRGGKRSQSIAWLLDMAGMQEQVNVLQGGYKAYRRSVQAHLAALTWEKVVVLGGSTGSGKTAILKALEKKGEQIIDLEGLCNHKGSAFGSLGENTQPSIEQFENKLYEKVRHFAPDRRVWLENEGRRIGKVYLAESIWAWLNPAPLINIELPFEVRLDFLIATYGQYPIETLKTAFSNIRKRLGGQNYQAALKALDDGELKTAASIALQYYDKSYKYLLQKKDQNFLHPLQFQKNAPLSTAKELIEYCENNNL